MNIGSRQSLLDMALQHCGSLEAAFDMAELNGLNLTDDLETGIDIAIPNAYNTKVVQHYTVNSIQPATAITAAEINSVLAVGEGIEFWGIEYDFIVQ